MEVIHLKLGTTSASELNQSLQQKDNEFVVIASSKSVADLEGVRLSAEMLKTDPNLKLVLHFRSYAAGALRAWEVFPIRLAALRENPTPRLVALVVRLSAAKELGFLDVSEPVWDFIIRVAQSPGSIKIRESSEHSPSEKPDRPGLAPLPPGPSLNWLQSHLQFLSPEDLVPKATSDADAIALKAGLWQIHDYLDASHELSQSIEGEGRHRAGDYWHAIMHRREPDYGNSKYWFRRVGSHPIFEQLAKETAALLSKAESAKAQKFREQLMPGGRWDPLAFVDFCQESSRSEDPQLIDTAERIQWMEMMLLLEQTYLDAAE
jgi:hypothetical protein